MPATGGWRELPSRVRVARTCYNRERKDQLLVALSKESREWRPALQGESSVAKRRFLSIARHEQNAQNTKNLQAVLFRAAIHVSR